MDSSRDEAHEQGVAASPPDVGARPGAPSALAIIPGGSVLGYAGALLGASLLAGLVLAAGLEIVRGSNWDRSIGGWRPGLDSFAFALAVYAGLPLGARVLTAGRLGGVAGAAIGVVAGSITVAVLVPRLVAAALIAQGGTCAGLRPFEASTPWHIALLGALLCIPAVVASTGSTKEFERDERIGAGCLSAFVWALAAFLLWMHVDQTIVEPLLWHC